ncbi:DUF1707 domain-containing protein [Corynebacterium gottingense]|uniref:DUF1707 domain-containing protein n=1 Tax=Corynebacterium gottingense TaxID=2041036 RepID=A0ABX9ULM7_9CORY|nr:DUF1707 domain-containing protein [Corynebacterium gottingense]
MTEHPSIRVGVRERSCASSRLSIHFAEGYLSVDELDERAQRVAAATTQGELDGVFSDLPSPPTQEELKELKRARSLTAFPRERELENKLFRREIRGLRPLPYIRPRYRIVFPAQVRVRHKFRLAGVANHRTPLHCDCGIRWPHSRGRCNQQGIAAVGRPRTR